MADVAMALLLNTLIIVVCILSYQVFWLDREEKETRNELLISCIAAAALVLCMTFPFKSHYGFYYDLRSIPILLCFLFGRIRSIVFVGLIYLAYRFYLGGAGFIPSVIIYFIQCFIVSCIYAIGPTFYRRKKIMGNLLVAMSSITLCAMAALHEQSISNTVAMKVGCFFLIHFLINVFTMNLALYLIHGMLEKKKLKEKHRRTEKMLMVRDLSASFAHEIRNPLTTVQGFTQLIINNPISEAKRNDYLQIMMSELQHAESILADYILLTKPPEEAQESCDLGALIYEAIETLTSMAADHQIHIQKDIQCDVNIEANPLKVKQCIINLMKNGIEAMTSGGNLSITLHRHRKNIVIDIIDSGVGMTREEINRIGLPFYSTRDKGTGLGTMVAYSIIKELNGDMEIKSKKGEGTRFSIIIPEPRLT